jgi:hypothetical protein
VKRCERRWRYGSRLNEDDILHGAPLLPEFAVRVGDLFAE